MAIVVRQASSIQSVAPAMWLRILATKAFENTGKSPTPSAGHIAGVALSNQRKQSLKVHRCR